MITYLCLALTVLVVYKTVENHRLNKRLRAQMNCTLDALNQGKEHLADNLELLTIIDNSSTKEEMILKYALNQSLKK